ncbi:NAD(P)/FAD-dependent oxidoreductase [Solirubrobacter phytolaccae]|uniref:NAD(P)/FAD-dependent oxidoreductase n=1 Tax=Solirubrobacter phytolaccae TaxID=1404360 RepID=A0A9X3S626_9ACTN|nr:NAD(P)/FAD-dependent oxidoreductase [Solirubrobacter phytolaccae]MDA0179569.1 NAD(P)/FAD-dependent oxidoreductase [Solirubrobacter phytolaccae]
MRVVIIGAGFGGIAAAIELRRHGLHDITILDRADGLGGTWLLNDYPGAACDVPSHLYSYSYAQRRTWPRLCSPRDEILAYIRAVAAEHGIDGLVTPNVEITHADHTDHWTLTATDGRTWQADALIVATGQLHRTHTPRLPGADRFQGHVFHSAEWDHEYDLTGKRVAVIGTGASAVQFVPEIARAAKQLVVFQRTGNWFMPRKNHPYPRAVRALIRRVPGLQAYRRTFVFHYGESLTAMIRHPRTLGRLGHARSALFMRWQLRNHPQLRKRIWPDYTFGCKRVLFSSHFLPALARENVTLVTEPPTVTEHAVNGHEVDCIIYATGFKATDFMFPLEITARGRMLRDAWADGPFAHLGITVPGFPSLYLMYGPNTNTSGGSILIYLEAQASYIRQALQHGVLEVRPEVAAASDRDLQQRFHGTAWTRCDSWYRDASGRIVTNWPGYMREYQERTKTFDPSEFSSLAP